MSDDCLRPPGPDLPVFTVTVAGPERHDGEAAFTYVLHAADADRARRVAMDYHVASQALRENDRLIPDSDGIGWTGIPNPAAGPDVVFVPDQSFPGAPDWPFDEPGRAWNDLRAPAADAAMRAVIAAEQLWLATARALGINTPTIDYDATDTPAVPAATATWAVAQLRARRALAPAGLQLQEEDVSAFICPLSHIQALTTAIDERDLAPGVSAQEIGQVLIDENYLAVNVRYDADDQPEPYWHRHTPAGAWALLKAADCYRYQLAEYDGHDQSAAWLAVGKLRTVLLDELGLEPGEYRNRWEYEAADAWPILAERPPREQRAVGLIEHYMGFDGVEKLSPPDYGQHIGDIIADLLHYANTADGIDPWDVLDSGIGHFTAEQREEQPDAAPLRLLVATSKTQGRRADDVCGTLDGEILFPPSECPHCHDAAAERTCHTLIGVDTGRATTTFAVADAPITVADLHLLLAKAWGAPVEQIEDFDIPHTAAQMIAVASRFPAGAVLGRSARRYRRRTAAPALPGPPARPTNHEQDPWPSAILGAAPVRLAKPAHAQTDASDQHVSLDVLAA